MIWVSCLRTAQCRQDIPFYCKVFHWWRMGCNNDDNNEHKPYQELVYLLLFPIVQKESRHALVLQPTVVVYNHSIWFKTKNNEYNQGESEVNLLNQGILDRMIYNHHYSVYRCSWVRPSMHRSDHSSRHSATESNHYAADRIAIHELASEQVKDREWDLHQSYSDQAYCYEQLVEYTAIIMIQLNQILWCTPSAAQLHSSKMIA